MFIICGFPRAGRNFGHRKCPKDAPNSRIPSYATTRWGVLPWGPCPIDPPWCMRRQVFDPSDDTWLFRANLPGKLTPCALFRAKFSIIFHSLHRGNWFARYIYCPERAQHPVTSTHCRRRNVIVVTWITAFFLGTCSTLSAKCTCTHWGMYEFKHHGQAQGQRGVPAQSGLLGQMLGMLIPVHSGTFYGLKCDGHGGKKRLSPRPDTIQWRCSRSLPHDPHTFMQRTRSKTQGNFHFHLDHTRTHAHTTHTDTHTCTQTERHPNTHIHTHTHTHQCPQQCEKGKCIGDKVGPGRTGIGLKV